MKKLSLIIIILTSFSILSAQSKYEAVKIAEAAANKLMNEVSPLTGKNSFVTTEKITYTKSTGLYKIFMNAYWYASPCIICDETVFRISGMLTISRDGSYANFMEISRNDAVSSAMIANNIAQIGGQIIINNIMSEKSISEHPGKNKGKTPTFKSIPVSEELTLMNDTTDTAGVVTMINKGANVSFFPTRNAQWMYALNGQNVGYVRSEKVK